MNEVGNIHPDSSVLWLKNIFYTVKSWMMMLKKNKIQIGLTSILVGLIGFTFAFFSAPKYKAELRFVEKREGSVSSLAGMLGGLGSVLGGNSIASPLERIVEVASSEKILVSALLSEVQISEKKDVLANVIIRFNRPQYFWINDTVFKNVRFSVPDTSFEKMSLKKREAIKKLKNILVPETGKGILSKSFDKKSGIVTISATHFDEELSIVLVKQVFNKLRDYYLEQMTNSSSNNVLVLQRKVDSIRHELTRVQSVYARSIDQSVGVFLQEDKLELKKMAIQEQILLAMYAEAQKNLETFKFMNDSAIPNLIIIDIPYSPLRKIQFSKVSFTFGGFFLGGLIAFVFIAFSNFCKDLVAV